MGWNISHGQRGEIRRSAATMHNLSQHVAHVLTAREWQTVKALFDRPSGDPFWLHPHDAARVAPLLHKAGNHRLMPANWAGLAHELADAAHRAADAGQNWRWR